MGYAQETGYVPSSFQDLMNQFMAGINTQFGQSYTPETFIGTNFYKFFYPIAQLAQANDVKASEVFLKVQDYFRYTNEVILDVKVTPNGLLDVFGAAGYEISIK